MELKHFIKEAMFWSRFLDFALSHSRTPLGCNLENGQAWCFSMAAGGCFKARE